MARDARLNSVKHVLRTILQGYEFTEKQAEEVKEYFREVMVTRTRWQDANPKKKARS